MNREKIEKNWSELKSQIQTKWGKFSEQEVDSLKGDLSQLAEKIQKAYGIAKEHADQQCTDFIKSVQSLIGSSIIPENAQFVPVKVTIRPIR